MAHDRRFTKHGFPKGFRFVPTNLELAIILALKVHGRRLHHKVANIFHELDILDYHPQELHDMFELDKEHRFIYFFSRRRHQNGDDEGGCPVRKKRQRGAGGQDEDETAPRPVRLARGGGWKPSGGGQVLRWPKDKGGYVAGKMVTMVFYDHHHGGEPVKTHWGMHEIIVPIDPRQLDKPTKRGTSFHPLALYRLYKIKSDDTEIDDGGAGSINQTMANVSAANGHFSAPAGQPSFGIFTGRNQNQPLAAAAAASTSRMPPPQLQQQQQQHRIPNLGRPQYYHHHQYAFGAAPPSAGHQRVHTMAMPPAYGTGMLPGRHQLFPFARPPGITGLLRPQSLQFARPPAPSQMPVLPAAGNLASHQQGPARQATTYGGAGQQASHPGATRMPLPSAPVPTTLPAAECPSAAEELAPVTAATHGGDFGATRSSDCVIKPDERVTPADNNDGIVGMPDYDIDLGIFDENCLFTMDELGLAFDELQQGDNN